MTKSEGRALTLPLRWCRCLALCRVHPRAFALSVTMWCICQSGNEKQCVVVINVPEAFCMCTFILGEVPEVILCRILNNGS